MTSEADFSHLPYTSEKQLPTDMIHVYCAWCRGAADHYHCRVITITKHSADIEQQRSTIRYVMSNRKLSKSAQLYKTSQFSSTSLARVEILVDVGCVYAWQFFQRILYGSPFSHADRVEALHSFQRAATLPSTHVHSELEKSSPSLFIATRSSVEKSK